MNLGRRVALAAAIPALIAAAGWGLSLREWGRDASARAAQLERRALRVERAFQALLQDCAEWTNRAVTSGTEAIRAKTGRRWSGRLEGSAILDGTGRPVAWWGTPYLPAPEAMPRTKQPVARLYRDGLVVRLLYFGEAGTDGRRGLLSLLLAAPARGVRWHPLLRAEANIAAADFLDARDHPPDELETYARALEDSRGSRTLTRRIVLRSPDGTPLAVVTLRSPAPAERAQRIVRRANALAAVLLCVAVGLVWGRAREWSWRHALAATLGVASGRALLLLTEAPVQWLPPSVASASFYGTPRAFGLFASPADLALTGFAAWLLVKIWGAWARERRERLSAAWALAVLGLCAMAPLAWVCFSLARDSRLAGELLESPRPLAVQSAVLFGLACLMLAAAEPLAAAIARLRAASLWISRVGTLLLVAAVTSTVLLAALERVQAGRLVTEYAPQVLEQAQLRRRALESAVERAAQTEASRRGIEQPGRRADETAYHLWLESDLFHAGYRSALDLYDPAGRLVGHFGFDMPPVEESLEPASAEPPRLRLRSETVSVSPAVEERVWHAEHPVFDAGAFAGTVVGHVLEEPTNLPFLPHTLPYLAALGPAARPDPRAVPDYVIYERGRGVEWSSLPHPPPDTPDLWEVGARAPAALRVVRAGAEVYTALPLAEADRLHLLLLPRRPWLDRLAAVVKLFALGLAAALLLEAPAGWRRWRGWARLWRSFQAKLLLVLLLASLLPLFGLAVALAASLERRQEEELAERAAQVVNVVQRVFRDYAVVALEESPGEGPLFDDALLQWLRVVLGQEIHLYDRWRLIATSRRELFAAGVWPATLPGEIARALLEAHHPYVLATRQLARDPIPVVYAPLNLPAAGDAPLVAAVPLPREAQRAERIVERVEEMVILATALLGLAVVASVRVLARRVARPVAELVQATRRIAAGDYATRLEPRGQDELAELVAAFGQMSRALEAQRRDLERRRDYIEALLRHATAAVLSLDQAHRLVTSNPAAQRVLGLGEEAIGLPLPDLLGRDPDLEPLATLFEQPPPPSGKPEEIELRRGGERRRYRVVRVRLPDPAGGPAGTLILMDDVTEWMRSHQLAAWAEMARAIAHEIKNPLTPIQLSAEHLERLLESRGPVGGELRQCLETIKKQVSALRQIAGEFSAYAKLPDLVLERHAPAALAREAIAPYRAACPPSIEIREHYEPAPPMLADRRVLVRALVNLIENAIQAMEQGGTLEIGVRGDPDRQEVVFWVRDTGPGLAPEVEARLFEPYFSTKSSGTGLGLAIVKRAVESHGGTVEVETAPGRGTCFRLRFPAAGASAGRAAPSIGYTPADEP